MTYICLNCKAVVTPSISDTEPCCGNEQHMTPQAMADEINRLKSVVAGDTTVLKLNHAEIERLTEGNSLLRRDRDDHKAEIERLKTENAELEEEVWCLYEDAAGASL